MSSWTGLIACVLALAIIHLSIMYIPVSRPDIRSAFNVYSWAYLGYWGITSLIAGISSLIIDGIMNIILVIKALIGYIPIFFVYFCLVVFILIQYLYVKYYKTTKPAEKNFDDCDEIEKQDIIARFKIIPYDGICPICLGPYNNATKPYCGHVFCYHCLTRWCRVRSETCPMCRNPVTAVMSERSPNDEDEPEPPALIELDYDDDILEEVLDEIFDSVLAYGFRFCLTFVFCFVWNNGIPWIWYYAIN